MLKKIILLITVLTCACVLCTTALAASPVSTAGYAIAITNTNVYEEHSMDATVYTDLNAGEGLAYTGEYWADDTGRSWVKVKADLESENIYWMMSRDVQIVDVQTVLDNYPNYEDGIILEMGRYTQGGVSLSKIEIYQVEADKLSNVFVVNEAPDLVFCSWTNDILPVLNHENSEILPYLQQKITAADYDFYYHWPSCLEFRTYSDLLILPDDESIAGPQTLVYVTKDKVIRADFVLEYFPADSWDEFAWEMSDLKLTVRDFMFD